MAKLKKGPATEYPRDDTPYIHRDTPYPYRDTYLNIDTEYPVSKYITNISYVITHS